MSPSETYDKDAVDIVLSCYDYYRQTVSSPRDVREGSVYENLQETLNAFLHGFAVLHQSMYKNWIADKENIGYLVKIDAPTVIWVPVHLVPLFPDDDKVNDLWNLASNVKTTNGSIICLSGSNAVGRVLTHAGDVDFCEYVFVPCKNLTIKLEDKLKPNSSIVCLKARICGHTWQISEKEDKSSFEEGISMIDPTDEELATGKYDFVATTSSIGATEVSNLMIFCNQAGASAGMVKTFAHQEAPFAHQIGFRKKFPM